MLPVLFLAFMYHHTQGIVISSVKYGENSRVVHCYTQHFGLQGYLVNALNKPSATLKPGMLLPLTQLHLVVTHKGKGTLERVREASVGMHHAQLAADPVRNALGLFVAEVLHRALRAEEANAEKFSWLQHVCVVLNNDAKLPAYFPSEFLIQLSRFLGFYPDADSAKTGLFFDLLEGIFVAQPPLHTHYCATEVSQALRLLLLKDAEINIQKSVRRQLLHDLLDYFRIHLEGFGRLKSVAVLEEIF
jgi:DNA repair protein RecO (recombination protein O)